MNIIYVSLFFILSVIGIYYFETMPFIEHQRHIIPAEIYETANCGCDCISQSRPWYSTFNYWFWFSILLVPALVFSVKPKDKIWKQISRTLISMVACYGVLIVSTELYLEIIQAPFSVSSKYPEKVIWDHLEQPCFIVGGGAKIFGAMVFGPVYAATYTGLWLMIWRFYHQKYTKLIDSHYVQDRFHSLFLKIFFPLIYLFTCLALFLIGIQLISALRTFLY